MTSISTPSRLSFLRRAPRLRGGSPSGALAADDGARRLVGAHQAQPPAAAGEEVLDHLLEVPGGRGEGLLEALLDAPVGLLDEALELGQRTLEVPALGLELLDVRDRLLVLRPASGLTGPSCSRRMRSRSTRASSAARSSSGSGSVAGSGSSPSRPASSPSSRSTSVAESRACWARDLGGGDRVARLA